MAACAGGRRNETATVGCNVDAQSAINGSFVCWHCVRSGQVLDGCSCAACWSKKAWVYGHDIKKTRRAGKASPCHGGQCSACGRALSISTRNFQKSSSKKPAQARASLAKAQSGSELSGSRLCMFAGARQAPAGVAVRGTASGALAAAAGSQRGTSWQRAGQDWSAASAAAAARPVRASAPAWACTGRPCDDG